MDIVDCYRVLGLTSIASAQEIKSSYRRLARKWHPDVNPNNQQAHEMFIRVTEAYKVLQTIVPSETQAAQTAASKTVVPRTAAPRTAAPRTASPRHAAASPSRPAAASPRTANARPPQSWSTQPPRTRSARPPQQPATSQPPRTPQQSQTRPAAQPQTNPNRQSPPSQPDPAYQVKLRAYEQLQQLLQMRRYPRAVAAIEALSQKLPGDPEIRQWQAIIYQRWGRQLIVERKYNQARAYLRKASMTDPNNKSLLAEIEQDLRTLKMTV